MSLGNDSTHSKSTLNPFICLRGDNEKVRGFLGEHGQISANERFPVIESVHAQHEVIVLGRVGDLFYISFLGNLKPLFKGEVADELCGRYKVIESANAPIGPEHKMIIG